MKKKKILFGAIAVVLVIVICIILKVNASGEILNNTSEIFAFSCSRDYGNKNNCGSWSTTSYHAVVRDGKIHVFDTYLAATADCGYTTEYVADITDSDIKKLKYFGWKYRTAYCDFITTEENFYRVLTEGMNDSRGDDWYIYFKELAEVK